MRKKQLFFFSVFLLNAFAQPTLALEEVYLSKDDFLSQAFGSQLPEEKIFWWVGERKKLVTKALGREPRGLRTRYWQSGDRTAWVFEAIGKEHPITAGFVVNSGKIETAEILIYRETRGWEVKFPAFRKQFVGASLKRPAIDRLDQPIDGISGATLSVQAVKGMGRLALLLHDLVQPQPTISAN